jgi:hypothetical protein
MKIERFQELKEKLTTETDLSRIWTFYMDHFADHAEFMELGEPAHYEYLNNILYQTCQQIFGKAITVTNFLLIHIVKHQFYHGPFQVKGRIGGLIYFEDIKVGLLAVSADFPPTDAVKFSRFSQVMELSKPNRNDLN